MVTYIVYTYVDGKATTKVTYPTLDRMDEFFNKPIEEQLHPEQRAKLEKECS